MEEFLSERTPIFGSKSSEAPPIPPPKINLSQLLVTLSAFTSGHLPTTSQLSHINTILLSSPLLQPAEAKGTIWQSPYGEGRVGVGKLTKEGERIRLGLRRVLGAWERVVKEGNRDLSEEEMAEGNDKERLQETWWKLGSVKEKGTGLELHDPSTSGPVPPVSSPLPELKNIISLFLTSSEFQSLLADLLGLVTQFVNQQAKTDAARNVAEVVDQTLAEFGVETDGLKDVHSEEEMKKILIERLYAIFVTLQSNPHYRLSVLSILSFFTTLAASPPFSLPTTTISPSSPFSLLPQIILAFSHSPSILLSLQSHLVALDLQLRIPGQQLSLKLIELQEWLQRVLLEEGYILKDGGQFFKKDLHDLLSSLSTLPPATMEPLQQTENLLPKILNECSTLLVNTLGNGTLVELGQAVAEVEDAVEGWVGHFVGAVGGKESLLGDLAEWVVPRVIGMIREYGVPRIEVTLPDVRLAVDCPNFLASDLRPDSIGIKNETELIWVPAPSAPPIPVPSPKPTTKSWLGYPRTSSPAVPVPAPPKHTSFISVTRLTLAGVRFETKNLGYFLNYKPRLPWYLGFVESCFGWGGIGDAGLVDLLVGDEENKTGGMDLTIELSTTTNPLQTLTSDSTAIGQGEEEAEAVGGIHSLWSVRSTKPVLKTFLIRPHDSTSHPIIVRFLQPVLTRVVKSQLEDLIEKQVGDLMDWMGRFGWEVNRRVGTNGENGRRTWKYLQAVVAVALEGIEEEEEEKKEEVKEVEEVVKEEEESGGIEVDVGTKGITIGLGGHHASEESVDTKSTSEDSSNHPEAPTGPNPFDDPPEEPQVEEEPPVVVIGVGAPGVVLPEGTAPTPALEQLQAAATTFGETLVEGKDEAVKEGKKAVRFVEQEVEEWKEGKKKVGKEKGWRSEAFDWEK